MKFKTYAGETLHNATVTRKIDGVRAHRQDDGSCLSRAGKPIYNIPSLGCDVAEIFLGSWEKTVSAVRTMQGSPVPKEAVYALLPTVDQRLVIKRYGYLDQQEVELLMAQAIADGYEGLVIHTSDALYKVKTKETHDVQVLGVLPGTGKHASRMGALITPKGKVGTGFSDADREAAWCVGDIIEVECMALTPSGKFRHPRFVRRRFDKV